MKSSSQSLSDERVTTSEIPKEKVFLWLDDNPELAEEYFFRQKIYQGNISKPLFLTKRLSQISNVLSEHQFELKNCDIKQSMSSSSLFSRIPNRINSFELETHSSKPIISIGSDGHRSFHINSLNKDQNKPVKKPSTTLKLNERDLINELTLDICNDLDISSLCFKILKNVCILLDADKSSLFLVEKDDQSGKTYLFSKLFDVSRESESPDKHMEHHGGRVIFVPFDKGIAGHVAKTGEFDPRFSPEIDELTGYRTQSILSMPIKSTDNGQVVGIAQVVNKRSSRKISEQSAIIFDEKKTTSDSAITPAYFPFNEKDIEILGSYVAFCSIGLHNAQIYQLSQMETRRSQILLELARLLFVDQSNVVSVIDTVLSHALQLMDCRICQLVLVSENYNTILDESSDFIENFEFNEAKVQELFVEVYEMSIDNPESSVNYPIEMVNKLRNPVNFSLCFQVLKTAQSVNMDTFGIKNPEVVLCSPIKNRDNHLVGICILIDKMTQKECQKKIRDNEILDKLDDTFIIVRNNDSQSNLKDNAHFLESRMHITKRFTKDDEEIFEAFAIFAGLAIANTQLFEKAVRAEAKQKIALDVLQYHAMASPEQADELAKSIIPSSKYFDLKSFKFSDFKLSDDDTLAVCLRIFVDFDLIDSFNIQRSVFCRWLLSVKKNYRQVTYHNWRHALNVLQTMFAIFTTGGLEKVFTKLEIFAIFVACISHDLDHRGTNNQYQIKTMSPLAQLYSTSVLEHHHFNQCMLILNSKGNDILSEFSRDERMEIVKIIEFCILATDLSLYFSHLPQFCEMAQQNSGVPDKWKDSDFKSLLAKILMTGCDVSAITKPWPVQKKVAEMVASEFFTQGDIERIKFNIEPQFMMDRGQCDKLPKMQLDFIDSICLPLYRAVANEFPDLEPLTEGCLANKNCWLALHEDREIESEWTQEDGEELVNKCAELLIPDSSNGEPTTGFQVNPILKETVEVDEELDYSTTVGLTESQDAEELID